MNLTGYAPESSRTKVKTWVCPVCGVTQSANHRIRHMKQNCRPTIYRKEPISACRVCGQPYGEKRTCPAGHHAHHWLLAEPVGGFVRHECKHCGQTRSVDERPWVGNSEWEVNA